MLKKILFIIIILVIFAIRFREYKLGDYVRRRGGFEGFLYYIYPFLYPNTLVFKYYKNTNISNNYTLLKKLTKQDINLNNTLIVHMRLGDVIDNHSRSVNDFWNKDISFKPSDNYWKGDVCNTISCSSEGYIQNKNYYEKIIEKINFHNINKVILVSGSHKRTKNPEKSQKYLQKVENLFKNYNYPVEIRWNKNPDDDFTFMCNSKYFVPSGGGFSKLIKELVILNNGIII